MAVSISSEITFAVDEVAPATEFLLEDQYFKVVGAVLSLEGEAALESCSRADKSLVRWAHNRGADQYGHGFVRTVNQAYDEHRPLTLSPDIIWLLIAQGVAQHFSLNVERLRSLLVSHEGKLQLKVQRDEFVKGFVGNDWEGVFAEWSAQIAAHVGPSVHGLLVQEFSTTGIVEKAAMEITLMDAFQAYFDYVLVTRCGIPAITLEGTPDDWARLALAAERLADFDLDWWTPHLRPVLEQFIRASQGDVDRPFWQEFYKRHEGSGGPHINGHLVNFFPYRKNHERALERTTNWERIHPGNLTNGLSLAPFVWEYYGTNYSMELLAGFVGATQHPETLSLRPEIGWAVRDVAKARLAALPRIIAQGDLALVKELLADGADVNAIDGNGDSPLMTAAYDGWPDIVRLLLETGADASLRNDNGETALDIARRHLKRAIKYERHYHRGMITRSEAGDREGLEVVIILLKAAEK